MSVRLHRNMQLNKEIDEILISDKVIRDIIVRVKSKIREEDVKLLKRFYNESANLFELFKDRMDRFKLELDTYDDKPDKKHKPVGFKIP